MAINASRSEQHIYFGDTSKIYYGWYVSSGSYSMSTEWFTSADARERFAVFVTERYSYVDMIDEAIAGLILIMTMGIDAYAETAQEWLEERDVDLGMVDWDSVVNAFNKEYVPCGNCGKDATGCCCIDSSRALPRVVWDDEYPSDDPELKMRTVRVVFDDSQHNFSTAINGTRAEIYRNYDNALSVSRDETQPRQRPVKLQFPPMDEDGVTIQIAINTENTLRLRKGKP